MRYFAWHELVYQRLIAGGATTWDRTPYDEYELRPLVAQVARQWLRPGQRVLVLGCGTGPEACHFAEAGMRVTGIDISPTAIDLAKKQAADRGLDVTWIVGDACDLRKKWDWLRPLRQKRRCFSAFARCLSHFFTSSDACDLSRAGRFDAVLDAHMLHCLALAPDRTALIRSVAGALVVGGRFIVATMIADESTTFPDTCELDDEGILWTNPSDDFGSVDCVERAGRRWIPTRYILRDPSPLRDALAAAGFCIEWQTIVAPGKAGDPAELQIVCRKRA